MRIINSSLIREYGFMNLSYTIYGFHGLKRNPFYKMDYKYNSIEEIVIVWKKKDTMQKICKDAT